MEPGLSWASRGAVNSTAEGTHLEGSAPASVALCHHWLGTAPAGVASSPSCSSCGGKSSFLENGAAVSLRSISPSSEEVGQWAVKGIWAEPQQCALQARPGLGV